MVEPPFEYPSQQKKEPQQIDDSRTYNQQQICRRRAGVQIEIRRTRGCVQLISDRAGGETTSPDQGLVQNQTARSAAVRKTRIAKSRPLRVNRASVITRAVSYVSVIPMLPSRFPSIGASRVCRYRDKATIVRAQTDRGVVSRARAGLIWLTDRGSLRVYLRLECATQS